MIDDQYKLRVQSSHLLMVMSYPSGDIIPIHLQWDLLGMVATKHPLSQHLNTQPILSTHVEQGCKFYPDTSRRRSKSQMIPTSSYGIFQPNVENRNWSLSYLKPESFLAKIRLGLMSRSVYHPTIHWRYKSSPTEMAVSRWCYKPMPQ